MSCLYLKPVQKIEKTNNKLDTIVIIGNGPVGIKAARLILEKNINVKILIFGEERNQPYNRVQLSLFLAGKIVKSQLDNIIRCDDSLRYKEYTGKKIISVDRQSKTVTVDSGEVYSYSKLIMATGSSPIVPKIEHLDLQGIYQFRTLEDADELIKSKQNCQNIYIVGSGPLGLETAFGMKQPHNNVTLQVRKQLMSHHFNQQAQQVLADHISASGIKMTYQNSILRAIGADSIEAVQLEDGRIVKCECLVFCSGVLPNIKLAKDIGLTTQRGIVVDQYTRTSDEDIYAIGECSEFESRTYGIVSPGFKQAKSCVEHIYGALFGYTEELPHIQVKFGGYTTATYGILEGESCDYFTYTNRLKGVYRKLVVEQGCLVGTILVGNWQEESELKVAISENRKFSERALKEFEKTGLLISKPRPQQVKNLPIDYLVCLCESVSVGELKLAVKSGCRTIETLGEETRAGTVCGSCKPMLANLLDTPAPNLVMRHQKSILAMSILSIILIILTAAFEPLAIAETVQFKWHMEKLWFDSFWKKVSGFTLLGLCFIAFALTIRKRWQKFNFVHLDTWRFAHSLVGMIALIALMVHTGVRMGNNLNFWLMLIFLAALMTGSLVGIFMTINHHWSDFKLQKHRLWWSRLHHTLLWMLLPLLGFHILSAYYF